MDEPTRQRAHRAFAIGFWANGALALVKLGVGWACGSVALAADGWHSLSDILINGGAWWAHRISLSPPDEDHHYGHGQAESAAGVLVGTVLVVGGITLAWQGGRGHMELGGGLAGVFALATAVVSIVANIGLTILTSRVGAAANSQGLVALARDNASDALTGVLVVVGILGSQVGIAWAEPAVAVMIGALITFMGLRSLREGFDTLTARVPDTGLRGRLVTAALAVQGVRGVQSARIHPLGRAYRVDMEISVDGSLTVDDGHRIAHAVERAVVAAADSVESVDVHVNPWHPGDEHREGVGEKLSATDPPGA